MNAAIPDKVAPNAAPAAYPLLFDDDVDDVEEAPVFMVRLKNDDELNEDEEVEDSAANTPFVEERREDLAAKTARFAALLNMMIEMMLSQQQRA